MMGTAFLGTTNNNNTAQNGYKPKKTLRNKQYITLPQVRTFSTSTTTVVQDFVRDKNLNPILVYDNLNVNLIPKIQLETKDLSGIYLILNKKTLSYYIGSAATNRFNAKFCNHLLHGTGSKVIKNVVKKDGLENFTFMILELFPEKVNQINNKELLNLEDFYIKSLLPDYNILTEAGSTFGYKHSEITRLNMQGKYCDINRKKLDALKEDLNNEDFTSKAIIVKNLNGTVYGEYSSVEECALHLNCPIRIIHKSLKSSNLRRKAVKKC